MFFPESVVHDVSCVQKGGLGALKCFSLRGLRARGTPHQQCKLIRQRRLHTTQIFFVIPHAYSVFFDLKFHMSTMFIWDTCRASLDLRNGLGGRGGLFGEEWPVGMCGHQPRAPRPQSREKRRSNEVQPKSVILSP